MKPLPGLTKCGLIVIGAFCLTAGDCPWKHNVVFLPSYQEADQIILPGTAISEEEAAQITRLLKASDENFYIIQPYEHGRPGEPFGKLPFPKCLKAHNFDPGDIDDGNKTGVTRQPLFSRWSRIIGLGCQTRCSSGTNMMKARGHVKSAQGSQDLVNAVKPILQKYQKEK